MCFCLQRDGRVVATEEGLAAYSLVWRSEFVLVEKEAVPGGVRARATGTKCS